MPGVVNTTYEFTDTDVITSSRMNNIMDESTFTYDAVDNSNTLEVTGSGKLKVKSTGITSNELATNAVTTTKIADSAITTAKIADSTGASDGVTTAKLATGAVTAVRLANDAVETDKIKNNNVTAAKLSGAQTGTAPIYGCRAWAKLNPYVGSVRTGAYKTGGYSRTATETTVTIANHGLKENDKIRLNFTSGTGTDGLYTVTSSANSSEFVVNHTGTVTSGSVEAQFVAIQGSGNISTASWYDSGDSRIVLNFTTAMPNVNYATMATGHHYPSAWVSTANEDTLGDTQLNTVNQCHIAINQTVRFLNVTIIG